MIPVSSIDGVVKAASMVASTHTLFDLGYKHKEFTETNFVGGYMLASLGRSLLHGDTESTGNKPITIWKVRCADFVALQAAYLRLYIDSFGALYNQQLTKHIPMAFAPSFEVHSKPKWRKFADSFEPVYTSVRNWMFTEASNLIDFGPYRPLVAFPEVRKEVIAAKRKRILIDVGANGFFASPKYLLDSYAAYLPFTHAIMIEPEPHFSASVPRAYSDRYNITFMQVIIILSLSTK